MSVSLYTVGYEGSDIDPFIATLKAVGIEHVIDIRDVPVSRKLGFSKKSLSVALLQVGIGYTHLKPLGDPKPGRDAMRQGDYQAFLKVYDAHVATKEAQEALGDAVNIAKTSKAVLLCFEREPRYCHRLIVAEHMGELAPFTVRHLGVNSRAPIRSGQPQLQ